MSSPYSTEKSASFYYSAKYGNLANVQSLSLDPEVDLDCQDTDGRTPFFFACLKGHTEIVRYLLDLKERSMDYNLSNSFLETPFSFACVRGHNDVVEMLLEDERIAVNRPNDDNQTPLYCAAYYGQVETVKVMFASARQINAVKRSVEGKSADEIAIERGELLHKIPWDSKEDYRGEKNAYFKAAEWIKEYEKDPMAVREKIRREFGYDKRSAGELFALVVYLSDGYMKIRETNGEETNVAKRFLTLASQLPIELQMVLCNRVFGRGDSLVRGYASERGFKKFAKE